MLYIYICRKWSLQCLKINLVYSVPYLVYTNTVKYASKDNATTVPHSEIISNIFWTVYLMPVKCYNCFVLYCMAFHFFHNLFVCFVFIPLFVSTVLFQKILSTLFQYFVFLLLLLRYWSEVRVQVLELSNGGIQVFRGDPGVHSQC